MSDQPPDQPSDRPNEPIAPETDSASPRRRKRRIWPRVLIGASALLVVVLGLLAFYGLRVNNALVQNIKRSDSLPTAGDRPTADPNAKGALNFVLLGSDSRNPDDPGEGRSDAIMIVHLNRNRDHAYITSFPRDMWVTIPGHGKAKINAAYELGGAPLMVTTLESLVDTRMDHVAQVNFEGFINMTETLGGITVKNDHAFSSHGFDYPKGKITIKGQQALWFVRERHSLPNGDLDRAKNQRKVIQAIVAKGLSAEIISDPAKFTAFVGGIAQHVTVDQQLSDDEIRAIAISLRLNAEDITLLQAPISGYGTEAGQSVDVVDEAKLKELATAMRTDTLDSYVKKYPNN